MYEYNDKNIGSEIRSLVLSNLQFITEKYEFNNDIKTEERQSISSIFGVRVMFCQNKNYKFQFKIIQRIIGRWANISFQLQPHTCII